MKIHLVILLLALATLSLTGSPNQEIESWEFVNVLVRSGTSKAYQMGDFAIYGERISNGRTTRFQFSSPSGARSAEEVAKKSKSFSNESEVSKDLRNLIFSATKSLDKAKVDKWVIRAGKDILETESIIVEELLLQGWEPFGYETSFFTEHKFYSDLFETSYAFRRRKAKP